MKNHFTPELISVWSQYAKGKQTWWMSFLSYNLNSVIAGFPIRTNPNVRYANVTGELDPDVTGSYEYIGLFLGKPSYREQPDGFFIFWLDTNRWFINSYIGGVSGYWWRHDGDDEFGLYYPHGWAEGISRVELFPDV